MLGRCKYNWSAENCRAWLATILLLAVLALASLALLGRGSIILSEDAGATKDTVGRLVSGNDSEGRDSDWAGA